jgi:hypothetical protein
MATWAWVVIGVAIVIVVLAAAMITTRRRRTGALQERFGPEYERTVNQTGQRQAAEAQLLEREERHQEFQIQPLAPAAQQRYQDDWRMIQAQFVDDPGSAVTSADALIQTVMRERGYPVEDFDRRADDLSVEHPEVVDNYRQGHRLAGASRTPDKGATEDLRRAMRHYRALFDDLIGAPSRADGANPNADGIADSYDDASDRRDPVQSSPDRRTAR